MKSVIYVLIAIAIIGMASAVVDLSQSNEAVSLFNAFMQDDLVVPASLPPAEAWNASFSRKIGGFDYAEVADMTNSFALRDLVRVGNLSDGQGHYLDGTKNYIQP